MPEKVRKRPVKPITAGGVQPQGVWRPGSFEQAAKAEHRALEAEVLAQMREALQPRLDEEVAHLKEKAQAAGCEAGRQAGYEAGYQAGLAEAKKLLEEEKQTLHANHKALIETLTQSLTAPLDAWNGALTEAMGALMGESLKVLMAADPENVRHHFQQQLKQALPQWQRKKVPLTLRTHPQWQEWLTELLPDSELISVEVDETLPTTRIEVTQATTCEVLDWQMMLDTFLDALRTQFQKSDEQASADPRPHSTPQ